MKDFDLVKELYKAMESAEKESRNNLYLLKPETIRRTKTIQCLIRDTEHTVSFNKATNSIEICVSGYVLDSCTCDLALVFQTVDLFAIDAMIDGKVCIEMKILNAADIIKGK